MWIIPITTYQVQSQNSDRFLNFIKSKIMKNYKFIICALVLFCTYGLKAQNGNTDLQLQGVYLSPFDMVTGNAGTIYAAVANAGKQIPTNGIELHISISDQLSVLDTSTFSDQGCFTTGSIWSVTWLSHAQGNYEVLMRNTKGPLPDGGSCELTMNFIAVKPTPCENCGGITGNIGLTDESGMGDNNGFNNGATAGFNVTGDPLPIKLGTFSTKVNDCSAVDILWDTYSEENFDRAEVQKSVDGKNFKTIGTVKSKGNGISVHNSYVFTDRSPLVSGTVYYRLKAIDLDNAFSYSKLATAIADCDGVLDMNIYPNPTQGTANVTFKGFKNKTECNVILLNVKGEVVKDYKTDPLTNNFLNVNDLPSGVYFLKLIDDSVSLQKKFVKIN